MADHHRAFPRRIDRVPRGVRTGRQCRPCQCRRHAGASSSPARTTTHRPGAPRIVRSCGCHGRSRSVGQHPHPSAKRVHGHRSRHQRCRRRRPSLDRIGSGRVVTGPGVGKARALDAGLAFAVDELVAMLDADSPRISTPSSISSERSPTLGSEQSVDVCVLGIRTDPSRGARSSSTPWPMPSNGGCSPLWAS